MWLLIKSRNFRFRSLFFPKTKFIFAKNYLLLWWNPKKKKKTASKPKRKVAAIAFQRHDTQPHIHMYRELTDRYSLNAKVECLPRYFLIACKIYVAITRECVLQSISGGQTSAKSKLLISHSARQSSSTCTSVNVMARRPPLEFNLCLDFRPVAISLAPPPKIQSVHIHYVCLVGPVYRKYRITSTTLINSTRVQLTCKSVNYYYNLVLNGIMWSSGTLCMSISNYITKCYENM